MIIQAAERNTTGGTGMGGDRKQSDDSYIYSQKMQELFQLTSDRQQTKTSQPYLKQGGAGF